MPQDVPGVGDDLQPIDPRHGDHVDLRRPQPGQREALGDGACRKVDGGLAAGDLLLFDGCRDHPVADDAGTRVMIEGVDPEDVHRHRPSLDDRVATRHPVDRRIAASTGRSQPATACGITGARTILATT